MYSPSTPAAPGRHLICVLLKRSRSTSFCIHTAQNSFQPETTSGGCSPGGAACASAASAAFCFLDSALASRTHGIASSAASATIIHVVERRRTILTPISFFIAPRRSTTLPLGLALLREGRHALQQIFGAKES